MNTHLICVFGNVQEMNIIEYETGKVFRLLQEWQPLEFHRCYFQLEGDNENGWRLLKVVESE